MDNLWVPMENGGQGRAFSFCAQPPESLVLLCAGVGVKNLCTILLGNCGKLSLPTGATRKNFAHPGDIAAAGPLPLSGRRSGKKFFHKHGLESSTEGGKIPPQPGKTIHNSPGSKRSAVLALSAHCRLVGENGWMGWGQFARQSTSYPHPTHRERENSPRTGTGSRRKPGADNEKNSYEKVQLENLFLRMNGEFRKF